MNNTSNKSEDEKGWLSAFLLIFGFSSVVIAVLAIVGGSLIPGLLSVGVAILFFALRRIIDQQQTTARRLDQIESELASRRGGGT